MAVNCTATSPPVDEGDPEEHMLLALLLTTAAGLCTTIGALAGFFSSLRDTRLLSIGLSVASGVMLFVSFAEILAVKSVDAFAVHYGEDLAPLYAYSCFFAGVAFNAGIDALVHFISKDASHHPHPGDHLFSPPASPRVSSVAADEPSTSTTDNPHRNNNDDDATLTSPEATLNSGVALMELNDRNEPEVAAAAGAGEDSRRLKKTGLITALAIGIHNAPEGLAGFVATLEEPSLGIPVVLAIALHNIPEGICVSLPIFYATGSAWKAFWWSFLSGISEPIGAALGYFVLKSIFDDTVYGVLFGVVAGMMTYITLKELLPTARLYDPKDRHVTKGVVGGMLVMAMSLVLFKL